MPPSLKVGDTIPEGTFKYIPWSKALEDSLACGTPVDLSTNEWKNKKVVLISIPGAFTPTCHASHLPPFVQKVGDFKKKGVDVVAVLAANDPYVMSGWGRVEGFKDNWCKKVGLEMDLSSRGMGIRTSRFAIVLENNVVKYLGVESAPGVTVSGADEVLKNL